MPEVLSPTPADVLDLGASILESEGWKRKDWGTFCGPKCADGALVAAAVELAGVDRTKLCDVAATGIASAIPGDELHTARMKAYVLHSSAFSALGNEIGGNVTSFNDDQRDKRKVVRAMRRAARTYRARQGEV